MSSPTPSVVTSPVDESFRRPVLDRWTIGAIAVVAYAVANVLHEGLGHGGACLLMGKKPDELNAIFLHYPSSGGLTTATRVIAAGGGVVNLIAGLLALTVVRRRQGGPSSMHYFLWLFAAVNLLMAFGYPLFSGVGGFGDWIPVTAGIAPPLVTRAALALIGAVLYFYVAPKLLMPPLAGFIDPRGATDPQVSRLMRLPYIVGGVLFMCAGLLNPYGWKLMLLSAAAASFGGTSLLAWYKLPPGAGRTGSAEPLQLRRSVGWIVAAIVVAGVFVGVLGPGIRF